MILGFIWTTGDVFCLLKQWPTLYTNLVLIWVLMKSAVIYALAKKKKKNYILEGTYYQALSSLILDIDIVVDIDRVLDIEIWYF